MTDSRQSTGLSKRIGCGLDVAYGAGFQVDDDSPYSLDCEFVEDAGVFETHRPATVERPHSLAFVDGTMRTEARLTYAGPEGDLSTGIAGSWAAGAVLVKADAPSHFDRVTVGRAAIFTGGHRITLPSQRDGWRWEPFAVDGSDIETARQKLQHLMRDAESDIAEQLCASGWLTVLDGPLHGIRHSRGLPVIGYVKTHHRRMLAQEHWIQVPRLAVRERSGLFAMGDELYGCYLRVGDPGPWAGPWAGIVRIETPSGIGRTPAINAVDRAAGWLPHFASALHRDPRAPVNLTPIAGLERHLHHLQGDQRLALRAVREAVLQRKLGRMDRMSDDCGRIGLVDGSVENDSRTFQVVLDPHVVIQLDDLVAITTDLPGGRQVTHYGIVTELRSQFEGADLPSDTGRVIDRTLPAEHVRRAEVRVLRVVPEYFVAPHAGAPATRAIGEHRTAALFEDEMTRGKLPVGLDLGGAPVYADMRFVDGRSGGHVSISGISGVATKTSYALFLLYQLLETEQGMDLLGGRTGRESVRALVFNTKGEDLLHVDRPNAEFVGKPDELAKWRALGVNDPGPFRSVRLYAPRGYGVQANVANVKTRKNADGERVRLDPRAVHPRATPPVLLHLRRRALDPGRLRGAAGSDSAPAPTAAPGRRPDGGGGDHGNGPSEHEL